MKRVLTIITLILVLEIGLFTLTVCGKKEDRGTSEPEGKSKMDYMFPTTHGVI